MIIVRIDRFFRGLVLFCIIFLFGDVNKLFCSQKESHHSKPYYATRADSAAGLNNLANIYLSQIRYDSTKLDTAVMYYHQAINSDEKEAGFKLNLAIAYLLKGDTLKSNHFFRLGIAQCDSSREKVYHLLKLDIGTYQSEKGKPKKVSENILKKNIDDQTNKLMSKKEKEEKKHTGKVRRTKPAGPKSLDPVVVKEHLFWKY